MEATMSDLRDFFRRGLGQNPPSAEEGLKGTLNTVRRRRRSRTLLTGIVTILIVGGVATGMLLLLQPLAKLSPGGGGNLASPPDTVRVECGEETLLLTSSVVRQPDGVHFELNNPAGAGALFARDPLDPQDSWMRGALADVTHAEFTLPLRPGTVLVACLHPPVETLKLPAEAFERLIILPPPDLQPEER
jgi:hypothetical protein